MKTATKLTLGEFCNEARHLDAHLIRAVVRQMGGWESFKESAEDVCRGGIDGRFHGFIYTVDTNAFAKRNRQAIASMAEQQAREFGTTVTEMIQGFGCFRHNTEKPTDTEIGMALYAGKNAPDGHDILNAETQSRQGCFCFFQPCRPLGQFDGEEV